MLGNFSNPQKTKAKLCFHIKTYCIAYKLSKMPYLWPTPPFFAALSALLLGLIYVDQVYTLHF